MVWNWIVWTLAIIGGLGVIGIFLNACGYDPDEPIEEDEEYEDYEEPETVDEVIRRTVAEAVAEERANPSAPPSSNDYLIDAIWYDAFRHGGK